MPKVRFEKYPEGGWLTYFEGYKYPVHGRPTEDAMIVAEVLKKNIVSQIHFLNDNWDLTLFSLFFFKRRAIKWLKRFGRTTNAIKTLFYNGEQHFDPENWSPSVRNLYESLILLTDDEWLIWAIKGICEALEADKGYRWPFQDILMAAKKDKLIFAPAKEFSRLIDIYASREERIRYKNLGKVVKIFLWTQPSLRKTISKWAENTDFKKFEMDRYDLWGATQAQTKQGINYHYGGFSEKEMYAIQEGL